MCRKFEGVQKISPCFWAAKQSSPVDNGLQNNIHFFLAFMDVVETIENDVIFSLFFYGHAIERHNTTCMGEKWYNKIVLN